jgi:hypothetical protein
LKVGTMTESCGKPAVCDGFSGPGLTASFMPPAYIRSLGGSQGTVPNLLGNTLMQGSETGQKGPKMPTTTNRGRAYIRRSRAIQWSSQRRSYEASTSPLNAR